MQPTDGPSKQSTFNPGQSDSRDDAKNLQIFLGGSCNPTTWRQNVAIPYLEMEGITYYNPQREDWTPEVVKIESQAKQIAKILLFVIDKQTRSTVSLIESAFMAGDEKNLVMVIYPFDYDLIALKDSSKQSSNFIKSRSEMTKTNIISNTSKRSSSSSRSLTSFVESTLSTLVSSTSSLCKIERNPLEKSTCTITSTKKTSSSLSAAQIKSKSNKNKFELDQRSLKAFQEEARESSGVFTINGEIISHDELRELKEARHILESLVAKQRIPMFPNILQALKYVSKCLNDTSSIGSIPTLRTDKSSSRLDRDEDSRADDVVSSMTVKRPEETEFRFQNLSHQMHQVDLSNEEEKFARDVYLSVDSDDKNCIETIVEPIMRENGLTYNCMSVNAIGNLEQISDQEYVPVPEAINGSKMTETKATLSINSAQDLELYPKDDRRNWRLAIEKEMCAIQSSRVLLFVITNKCRGLSIMVLASHFMALFRKSVVLCIQYLEEPCSIGGETLTKTAVADYNRGRVYLCDYATKSQVPVFSTIREAIECCSQKCRYNDIK